jgi:hypothetical protein
MRLEIHVHEYYYEISIKNSQIKLNASIYLCEECR